MDELNFLDGAGAAGAVLGMALYTQTLDPSAVAARWGGGADISQPVKNR
jgi:phosphoribosylformimino-5-aminoimidazole carboxamide ribonucleotide (ProFAR) isomerase